MNQQLNLLTKKNNTGISKDTDDLNEILAKRNQISNEMLLEKIKNQNQRLNDVVKQLKLLAQNQQNQSENRNLVADANTAPLKPIPTQQVPVLITGASAVPAKPAQVPKGSVSRSPNIIVKLWKGD